MILNQFLEAAGTFLPARCRHFGVRLDALFLADVVDNFFKRLRGRAQHDLTEHLDQAAVRVPREAHITELRAHGLDARGGQTQVEDGVHHTGHRHARARTNRHQQRIVRITERLAGLLVQLLHAGDDLIPHAVREPAVFLIGNAGFGRSREAGWDRDADARHFCQVGALATQQVTHLGVTFLEHIHPLMRHLNLSSMVCRDGHYTKIDQTRDRRQRRDRVPNRRRVFAPRLARFADATWKIMPLGFRLH